MQILLFYKLLAPAKFAAIINLGDVIFFGTPQSIYIFLKRRDVMFIWRNHIQRTLSTWYISIWPSFMPCQFEKVKKKISEYAYCTLYLNTNYVIVKTQIQSMCRLTQVKITHLLVSKANQSHCFRYAFIIYMYYSIFHKGLFILVVFLLHMQYVLQFMDSSNAGCTCMYFPRQTRKLHTNLFEDLNFTVLKMRIKYMLRTSLFPEMYTMEIGPWKKRNGQRGKH